MADTMTFPKTLDEFMEQYKIVDTEQVYTNGAELVPIFRIKQWEDAHQPKKGKWMTKSTFMPDHYGGYYIDQYVCTNCESEFFKPSKFCPNCGANMGERRETE